MFRILASRWILPFVILLIASTIHGQEAKAECDQPPGTPFYGLEKAVLMFHNFHLSAAKENDFPDVLSRSSFKDRVIKIAAENLSGCVKEVISPDDLNKSASAIANENSLLVVIEMDYSKQITADSNTRYAQIRISFFRQGLKYVDMIEMVRRHTNFERFYPDLRGATLETDVDQFLKSALRLNTYAGTTPAVPKTIQK